MLGIKASTIEEALHTYPGLPHRMERVRELGGVVYVNDSKATNPTSTAPALAAFPAIHWILGGRAKTSELDACVPYFGHVRAAYTIGESAGMFASLLKGSMPVSECGSLDIAVRAASKAASEGPITPETISAHLDTADLPPLDLLIRTSGEERLSNFLLWQAAYAEMLFVDTLWPDFGAEALAEAVADFARRERRYGGL